MKQHARLTLIVYFVVLMVNGSSFAAYGETDHFAPRSSSGSAVGSSALCRDLFAPVSALESRARSQDSAITTLKADVGAKALALVMSFQSRGPLLDRSALESQQMRFAQARSVIELKALIQAPHTLDSIEARLAAFERTAEINGYSLDSVAVRVSMSSRRTQALVVRLLNKMSLDKSVDPQTVRTLFSQLYLMGHSDPLAWESITQTPLPETVRDYLYQRFQIELGRNSMVEAMRSLLPLKENGPREQLRTMYEHAPVVFDVASAAGVGVMSYFAFGWPLPPGRNFTHLASMPKEWRDRALRDGFDSIYPDLKAKYGSSAKFDIGYFWGSRVIMTAFMAYAVSSVTQYYATQLLPANVIRPRANFIDFVVDSVHYFIRSLRAHEGLAPAPGESAPEKQSVDEINSLSQQLEQQRSQIQQPDVYIPKFVAQPGDRPR